MPPILLEQWEAWILELSELNGGDITLTKYKGTPAKRKKMDLDADFILMSIQIMKRDISFRKVKNPKMRQEFF